MKGTIHVCNFDGRLFEYRPQVLACGISLYLHNNLDDRGVEGSPVVIFEQLLGLFEVCGALFPVNLLFLLVRKLMPEMARVLGGLEVSPLGL